MRSSFEARKIRARGVALLVACTMSAAIPKARADEKQVCLSAFDKSQQLRIDGKLRAAREQLATCARRECPQLVRQDCGQWLNEVISSMPSIVVGARDEHGKDLLAVRVSVDGTVVAESLDGKPILVDPGAHKLRFETPGVVPIEEQLLIRAGEKNRVLTVNFSAKPKEDGSKDPPKGVDPPDTEKHEIKIAPPPYLSYAVGGFGVLALGAALFFDLKGNGDANTLRTICAPNCRQDDVDGVQTKYVAAGVSLGIGVVALGVATYLFVTRDGAKKTGTGWNLAQGRF